MMGARHSFLRSIFIRPSDPQPSLSESLDHGSAGEEKKITSTPLGGSDHLNPMPSTPAARIPLLFALIIGINEYANRDIPGLKGAVSDAQQMKRYLREVLHVPEDRIRTLLNRKATRDKIIKALQDLQADQRIQHGDPIVIFYAGHGIECDAPPGWGPQSKIQCLLPQDCNNTNVIPDRTIGALIESIAKVKGDNITVIFDCCHSASGTRDRHCRVRTAKLDAVIPANLDSDIWGSRDGSISNGFDLHGLRSHVLLAACGEEELAQEDEQGGHFTKALLEILRECGDKDLTYTELCERVRSEFKKPTQTPRCEGHNQHRVIFDAKVPVGRQAVYPVEVDNGKCVIYAGRAHGVSSGVGFTLYSKQERRQSIVVSVDHNSVIEDFKTTVTTTSVHLGDVSLAKLTRVGNVSLYLTPGERRSVLEGILQKIAAPNFQVVDKVEEAKLEIALEDNLRLATFKIVDPQLNRLGLTKLPHKATLDRLAHVLDAAAHYFWYLDLENTDIDTGSNPPVAVNFYLLETEHDKWGLAHLVPHGEGLCRNNPNSEKSDVIEFTVDPDGRYGIEIKNYTPRDLYLNAFLFNNSSLSIASYYTQQTTFNPETPLKTNGTITIGYGSGGAPPFSYSLEKGQEVDVGYLKIFFATKPIDLCYIVQKSPFGDMRSKSKRKTRHGTQAAATPLLPQYNADNKDIWFTTLIPVVQRRN